MKPYFLAGHLELSGNISYASQDPWLFPATVKQNILFGEEFEPKRYEEVIRVCALEYDLSLLDNGDQTILTDNGQNFSKGQQARINLARALYRDTNIYLLDDSLTALDSHVQEFIFQEAIMKFLRDKIVILISQNPYHMKKAGNVVTLNEGQMISKGLEDSINIVDTEAYRCSTRSSTETTLSNRRIRSINIDNERRKSSKKHKKKLSHTEQQQTKKHIYREVKKEGGVEMGVYKQYFQLGGGFFVLSMIILLYVGSQFCDSYADKLLTQW